MKCLTKTCNDDSLGTALVEFAFVLPVLTLIMFGVIQFGMLFSARLALETAAAESARYASLSPEPTDAQVRSFAVAAVAVRLDTSLLDPPVVTRPAVGGVAARKVALTYHHPNYFNGVLPGFVGSVTIQTSSVTR